VDVSSLADLRKIGDDPGQGDGNFDKTAEGGQGPAAVPTGLFG